MPPARKVDHDKAKGKLNQRQYLQCMRRVRESELEAWLSMRGQTVWLCPSFQNACSGLFCRFRPQTSAANAWHLGLVARLVSSSRS